jgi:hypothetical protein
MPRPDDYAQRVLDELHITSPRDLKLLEAIAWERGATVIDGHLTGAEARITMRGRKAVITVSTRFSDPRRRRFSIAHEVGHLEMHRHDSPLAICTSDDIDNWEARQASRNREQEANEFAAALLLPERFIRTSCQDQEPSLPYIAELAYSYETSLTATALRFVSFSEEPCAVVFSKDGTIRWFRGSQEFNSLGVFVTVRSKLDPDSLGALHFQGHDISKRPSRVEAASWFHPGPYRKDATIREQSYAMPTYNSVLTLLWVDEDLEDDDSDDED